MIREDGRMMNSNRSYGPYKFLRKIDSWFFPGQNFCKRLLQCKIGRDSAWIQNKLFFNKPDKMIFRLWNCWCWVHPRFIGQFAGRLPEGEGFPQRDCKRFQHRWSRITGRSCNVLLWSWTQHQIERLPWSILLQQCRRCYSTHGIHHAYWPCPSFGSKRIVRRVEWSTSWSRKDLGLAHRRISDTWRWCRRPRKHFRWDPSIRYHSDRRRYWSRNRSSWVGPHGRRSWQIIQSFQFRRIDARRFHQPCLSINLSSCP